MHLATTAVLFALLGLTAAGFVVEYEQETPEMSEDDFVQVGKRLYVYRNGYGSPSKRSSGQIELMKDGQGLLEKRSMAIGRAGMRPGKRAAGIDKKGPVMPESYFPQNRFVYFEE